MRSGFSRLAVAGLIVVVAACGSGAATQPDNSTIKWVDVLPASYSLSGLGASIPFTPAGEDRSGGPVPSEQFVWTSSHPEVVSVTAAGGVGTVFAYGVATVTAAAGDRSGSGILLSSSDQWSQNANVEVVSRSDAIQAAVLGTGPLVAQGIYYGCSYPGLWTSFPRGTSITVRVSTNVDSEARAAIRDGLSDVPAVTGGALSTVFELTSDPNPVPGRDEVTVAAHPTPTSFGCRRNVGCTLHEFRKPGVLHSSRVVLPLVQTANAFVHDAIGHGILGMCHVDAGRIGRAGHSLMSNGPFTNSHEIALSLSHLDMEVERAVWASALNPGANSKALVNAGLIRPTP